MRSLRSLTSASTAATALLAGALAIFVYGIGLAWLDLPAFELWIREDGLAEWLTAAILALASGYALAMCLALRDPDGSSPRSTVWLLIACAMAFGALEEVSYGQRVFGWESPEWFLIYNSQEETNLHNLRFWGIKINRWVFGKFLAVFIVSYVLVLPLLYPRKERVRSFADRWGLPIAQSYQIWIYLLVLIPVRLSLHLAGKVNELMEFMGAILFFLILCHPRNAATFPDPFKVLRRRGGEIGKVPG